jgi:hypothetical protein
MIALETPASAGVFFFSPDALHDNALQFPPLKKGG